MQRRRLPMRAKLCAFIHSVALGHAAVGYLCFVRYIVLGSRNLEQANARLIDWATVPVPFDRAGGIFCSNELTCFARIVWIQNSWIYSNIEATKKE